MLIMENPSVFKSYFQKDKISTTPKVLLISDFLFYLNCPPQTINDTKKPTVCIHKSQ